MKILNRIVLVAAFILFFISLHANSKGPKLELDREKVTLLLTSGLNEHGISERVDSKLLLAVGNDISMLAKFRQLAYHYRLYLLSAVDEDSEETIRYAKMWSQDIKCIMRASSDAETLNLLADIGPLTTDYDEILLNAQRRVDSIWSKAPKQYHQFLKEC